MSIAEMRTELKNKIDVLDEQQLGKLYDVIEHFNDDDDWNEPFPLSELEEAIQEADKGGGRPAKVVMQELKEKYGLNG